MKIAKFGGTSVGSPEAVKALVGIVRERGQSVVVVSAFAGVTDALIATAEASAARDSSWIDRYEAIGERHRDTLSALTGGGLADAGALREAEQRIESLLMELLEVLSGIKALRELSKRTLDLVMSFGERLSAVVIAAAFRSAGIDAVAVDARALIVAEGDFGNARPVSEATVNATRSHLFPRDDGPKLGGGPLPVVTGFIASTPSGETITLGRGGSDYTAAIIGAVLGADEVEIWTDVDGILTADPRKVPDAFSLDSLSYEEAMELSHFGAKVIYPPSIQPALERGIPIRILNTFNPSFAGTTIASDAAPSRYPVRGISSISSAALVRVQGPGLVGVMGIAMRLFGCLARRRVNIILISQASSERSICFAALPSDKGAIVAAIADEFGPELADGRIGEPVIEIDKAIIAIVGERMKHTPGISGRVFHSLGRNGVNVSAIAQGSSEINISAVIDAADEARALNAVHEAFFLSGTRSVNVFLAGCGLVGGTLLKQIARQRTVLSEDYSVRVEVIGIANSRKMLIRESGISLDAWKDLLETEGESTDLAAFVDRARDLSLPNAVFVDCTASDAVPRLYERALRGSTAVVTPNKRGNTGPLPFYFELMRAARESGSPYLYETTAGAGLPVISTLHDLMVSGDRIVRIEAMLSGTIGYVLSNYDGSSSFATLLRKAKELGYTEPDPRDDLCAADAARKALILARECGRELEFADIAIEPLLPPSCVEAPSVEAFFVELEREEPFFRAMIERSKGANLVYAATIDDTGIRLGLRAAAQGDPLFGLRDAENVVAFTTGRYSALPLVVRGPGAGGEVTAGGLFADIVRIAKSLV
ncbi:MAG: bifunctional aspartate kinase/homoserine dehydrogenase I [Rectinemataceae bacterium]|jgi:aspartokinase/homoserine dehydrogenase 1